jgi:hypothetical protein
METIHVSSWEHLKQFGINMLTGEACAYAQRLLCDVNEEGRSLLVDYFGLAGDEAVKRNWNDTQINGLDAVGSFMLHRNSLMQVAEFAMLRSNPKAVVYKGREAIMAIYTDHMMAQYKLLIDAWPSMTDAWTMRTLGKNTQPHVGSRNTHAYSGRTD